MYHNIRIIMTSNIVLKFIAIIIGCGVWMLLGSVQQTTRDIIVPLCFYNVSNDAVIEAPEEVTVRLAGSRNELYAIRPSIITVHYDAQKLSIGSQIHRFEQTDFFLPSCVSMVHCTPASCTICMLHTEA